MAITNRDRVSKALDSLSAGLAPYVERELKAVFDSKWTDALKDSAPKPPTGKKAHALNLADTQILLGAMWNHWNDVFTRTLGHAERSLVSELRDVRNRWAHNEAFAGNDAYRALDSVARLLTAVSAPQAADVEQMRMDLLRLQFDEQRRQEMRKASFQPTEGKPQGGLPPWREVVTPHPDVSSGRYQQAEFAADLWQVFLNEGSDEYKHPTEFYRRTFITEGLRHMLTRALARLNGTGGDPVVELQTNFGGGKTHSMLALWHLFSGTAATELPGVEELVKETGGPVAKGVRRAVIVGTKISPGQPHKKPDGCMVRTLWGEIAWQLGGKEGYKLLKEADETATNPGDLLKDLFNKYSPCLILIDEWVAYARQLHEGSQLPAGTFDTHFTFAQAISEAAKAAKKTLLVVSVPSSDNEIGGEWGRKALDRIKNAIGRVESSWRPASPDEGFEIVRRRLFEPINNEKAKLRDAVARAFSELYGSQQQEFPPESPTLRRLYLIANRDGWNQRDSSVFVADNFAVHQIGYSDSPDRSRDRMHKLRRLLVDAEDMGLIQPCTSWGSYMRAASKGPLKDRLLLRWSRGPNLRKKEDRPSPVSADDFADDALFAQVKELRDEHGQPLDARNYSRLLAEFGTEKIQKHVLVVLAQKEHHSGSFQRSEVAAFIDRLQNDHPEPDWYQDLKRAERLSPFDGTQPNQLSLEMYETFFRE